VSETKIARVYARALYEAAAEAGAVADVSRDLGAFVDALRTSTVLRNYFFDEGLGPDEKKETVLRLTDGGQPLVRNFLCVLVDKDREEILEEAYGLYQQRVEKEAGVVKVELTTAVAVSAEVGDSIKQTLEGSLNKSVDLTLTVDEEILGGVRLRIGDRIADASIRHRLEQLRARLVSPTVRLEGSVETAS
jgi:F-type H+-transporting ATPase subunit delta